MNKPVQLLLLLVLQSSALGAVTTQYLGDDLTYLGKSIQGNWVGNVGADGYHLLYWGGNENQKLYPAYLGVAQNIGFRINQWAAPSSSTDARLPRNASQTQRAATCWVAEPTAYARFAVNQNVTFVMGMYFLDWDRLNRRATVAVCDISRETTPPWQQDTGAYDNGRWFFVRVNALAGDTLSIRVSNLSGENATVSMLSFDPCTRISQFAVSDRTTSSAEFTDEAMVNVTMSASAEARATISGYLVTETPTQPTVDDPRWLPQLPPTCTITGGQGFVTLYGWVKDSLGQIVGATTAVTYYQASGLAISGPTGNLPGAPPGQTKSFVITVSANDMVNVGAFEAHVEIKDQAGADAASKFVLTQRTVSPNWTTLSGAGGTRNKDLPDGIASMISRPNAGPPAQAVGSGSLASLTYEYGSATIGTFTFGLRSTSAMFDSDLSTNILSQLPGPVTVTIVQPTVEGDANGDGRVNVMDLIKCRNNLGKTCLVLAPADKAADANRDGRVNVMDLIYIRNRLGKVIWSAGGPFCPN